MGGLKKENLVHEGHVGPLEEFALENIRNTSKIMARVISQPEKNEEKFLRTMQFLGHIADYNEQQEDEEHSDGVNIQHEEEEKDTT